MDVSESREESFVLINPEIIKRSEQTLVNEEGCLSVPGCYAKVDRHTQVTVRALDINGKPFELDGEELLAICIQHELDHLQGKLFVDYLSPLKRKRIQTKLEKEARLTT
jgi:peptide deformylase